ncbi:MAG TPA: sugar ABC transporter permease [Streptosporangiaceae bacterium]
MADTAQRRTPARPAGQRLPRPGRSGRGGAGAFIRRHKIAPYLLLLPALAGIALVLLWPLAQVVMFSFQNYGLPQLTGAAPTQWVGLANFTATLKDPEFWLSLRTTVLFAAVVVPLTLVTGTVVGLLLNRLGRKMAAFVSGAALLAWATPPTAGAVLFYWLFNPDGGLVDWALARLPHWLVGSTNWAQYNWTTTGALQAYTVLTILVLWTSFPFIAVTVLAGLKTVPAELYEAAWVDGASRRRVFWRVTYPLLKPIFLVLLLLSVIWDFNIFTQTFLITGFPANQNEFNLSLYMYAQAFGFPPSYGLGGALALIFTLILLVVTVGYVRASVRQGALS